MKTKTFPWDVTEHLKTDEDIAAYLEAAFEDGEPVVIRAALGHAAKARGMTALARDAGLSRETLYKALREDGNPTLDTLVRIMTALGVRIAAAPLTKAA